MMTEDDLDTLFAAARDAQARLPPALTARVLADAAAQMPAVPDLRRAQPHPGAAQRGRLWGLFGGMGGAFAGMVTATIAGFWIGFAQPVELGAMSAVLTNTAVEIDMMPGLDALLNEVP